LDFNQQLGIDLHIHSNASDGTCSPSEILSLSQKQQVGAIAITDHDTIDGSAEAIRLGIPPGIKFVTGVEISATPPLSFHAPGSFHILGYDFRQDDPVLNQTLDKLQKARKNRNPQIIERLNGMDVKITLQEVCEETGDGQMGRPHIARVLIKKGYARSIDEAFNKYLGKEKPAYVDKFRLSSPEAIALIRDAGGVPVLAHPVLLETRSNEILENLVHALQEMGLMGIEVYYPSHSPDCVESYRKLAQKLGLLMTGGTDFHGSLKPDIQIGSGSGDFFVPFEVYEALINRA
jgi:3',5'-nucleoside bisphosphate phosphatase